MLHSLLQEKRIPQTCGLFLDKTYRAYGYERFLLNSVKKIAEKAGQKELFYLRPTKVYMKSLIGTSSKKYVTPALVRGLFPRFVNNGRRFCAGIIKQCMQHRITFSMNCHQIGLLQKSFNAVKW